MKTSELIINNTPVPMLVLDVAVVGSGCAGFNAADWLYDLGRRDIAVLTEGVKMGTSRNTGSDKQTYYKLSLSGDADDSIDRMAQDLFAGGGVHGDTALAEAANSARSFIKLANLGVPFPTNEYGEYVGYKTDNDPKQRATSAGPLTSKYITECLEASVRRKGIRILDGITAVKILTRGGRVEGLLCLDRATQNTSACGLFLVRTRHVILATGGPAGCYHTSVYPESQTGMSGMALEAGALGANLQEWQYGLASVKFRWNVSGTYQQVLPRYISVAPDGTEREFLPDYYDSPSEALDMVFLKGYEWPFDAGRVNGSSMIDIIVHREVFELGRRVYMDFRSDPTGLEEGFGGLGAETYGYLEKSGALIRTPIARLERMNRPAIELYRQHGIDLFKEPLEVRVCAQHHNGGIAVDGSWQTCVQGLYAAGEAAGTFGVHRPGGSALNSTQVGSMRAAEHIAFHTKADIDVSPEFEALAAQEAGDLMEKLRKVLDAAGPGSTAEAERLEMQKRMSLFAAHIRSDHEMARLERDLEERLKRFYEEACISDPYELPALLKNRDIFITQLAVLSAMRAAARDAGTRGSAMVLCPDGERVSDRLPGLSFECRRLLHGNLQMETEKSGSGFVSRFKPVRPLPSPDRWFENVWNEYRRRTADSGQR